MKITDYLMYCLFPDKCISCGKVQKMGVHLCSECEKENPPTPFTKQGDKYLEYVAFTFFHEGGIKSAIWSFKFRDARYLKREFGKYMTKCYNECFKDKKIDCLVPVPMTKKHRRERGYNQTELLAGELSRGVGVPVVPGLIKTGDRQSQHKTGLTDRRRNVKGLYSVSGKYDFGGKTVLIVDDVVTTGLTLYECAKALRKAGAKSVYGITIAAANNKTLVKYY